MKKIKTSKNNLILVDDDVFDYLNQWKWIDNGNGYVYRMIWKKINGRRIGEKIYMHRLIINTPKGKLTDHINRNKLDNRKENLRFADVTLNLMNSTLRKDNLSGYKGVCWDKSNNKWFARLNFHGKEVLNKHFVNLNDAIKARSKSFLKWYHKGGEIA